MDKFYNRDGKVILDKMVRAIQENKDYLGEVDGLIGDGDHGMNMNKGFTLFQQWYQHQNYFFTEGLEYLGGILFNEIGGSMGPIYGTLLSSMTETVNTAGSGTEDVGGTVMEDISGTENGNTANMSAGDIKINLEVFCRMLSHGMEELFDIIDARAGDKTLVDTLYPAVESLRSSVAEKRPFREALLLMKEAAEQGRDSTVGMIARYGRSSRLGERSRGVPDAGAVSCCLLLTSMADGILDLIS